MYLISTSPISCETIFPNLERKSPLIYTREVETPRQRIAPAPSWCNYISITGDVQKENESFYELNYAVFLYNIPVFI